MQQLTYDPAALKRAGLQARWHVRQDGRRVILARDPRGQGLRERVRWWPIDAFTWSMMQRLGVRQGFACSMIGREASQA
jgi:hypothetical protein